MRRFKENEKKIYLNFLIKNYKITNLLLYLKIKYD